MTKKISLKKIWNRKISLTRFWTGVGMQLVQAFLVTFWVFTTLNWDWFKAEYVAMVIGAVVLIGYNFVSWKLLLRGLRDGE